MIPAFRPREAHPIRVAVHQLRRRLDDIEEAAGAVTDDAGLLDVLKNLEIAIGTVGKAIGESRRLANINLRIRP